jgi:hypothetical protein
MKKTLAIALGFALVTVAFGQGTVTFSLNAIPAADRVFVMLDDPPDGDPANDIRLTGGHWKAQLWYAAGANAATDSLLPIDTVFSFRDVDPSNSAAGTWANGTALAIPGVTAGQTATLQVRVWDSRESATFPGTELAGTGVSGTWNYTIPMPGDPASAFFLTPGLTQFSATPIPEPTILALVGVGALGLLIRRRK